MGAVARPGVYVVDNTVGVLSALAAAGGLTQYAHEDRVFVLRQQRGSMEPVRIRFNHRLLSRAEGKASHFHLQRDDLVVAE